MTIQQALDLGGGPEPVAEPAAVLSGDMSFVCPRCGIDVVARFCGPCAGCRSWLRENVHGDVFRDLEWEGVVIC